MGLCHNRHSAYMFYFTVLLISFQIITPSNTPPDGAKGSIRTSKSISRDVVRCIQSVNSDRIPYADCVKSQAEQIRRVNSQKIRKPVRVKYFERNKNVSRYYEKVSRIFKIKPVRLALSSSMISGFSPSSIVSSSLKSA